MSDSMKMKLRREKQLTWPTILLSGKIFIFCTVVFRRLCFWSTSPLKYSMTTQYAKWDIKAYDSIYCLDRRQTVFLCNNPIPSYLIRIRYLIVGSFYLAKYQFN